MKIYKLCISIIAVTIVFFACKSVDLNIEANKPNSESLQAEQEIGPEKEPLTDFTIGHGQILSDDGITYEIDVILKDGFHYYEDDMGPFYGDNYKGIYEIVLKKDGNIINHLDLSKDWQDKYDDELFFSREFEIELIDYDRDGNYEFLIGQYFSSNLNLYKMYQVNTSKDELIALKDVGYLNFSGYRETEKLTLDDDGNYYVNGYDNSEGKYFKIPILFQDGKITRGELEYNNAITVTP